MLILFSRDIRDECFEGLVTTIKERFEQLQREIGSPLILHGNITHDGDSEVFLVEYPAFTTVAELQRLYDEEGVSGWFEVTHD
jgi:hypothetical protein